MLADGNTVLASMIIVFVMGFIAASCIVLALWLLLIKEYSCD